MKSRLLVLGLCVCGAVSVRAQLFNPDSIGGAAFGALTGALIAGHHNAGTGAAIGAGAGFLLGNLAYAERESYYPRYYAGPYAPGYYYGPYGYVTAAAPTAPAVEVTQAAVPPPQAPLAPTDPPPRPRAMSEANALFGR